MSLQTSRKGPAFYLSPPPRIHGREPGFIPHLLPLPQAPTKIASYITIDTNSQAKANEYNNSSLYPGTDMLRHPIVSANAKATEAREETNKRRTRDLI